MMQLLVAHMKLKWFSN